METFKDSLKMNFEPSTSQPLLLTRPSFAHSEEAEPVNQSKSSFTTLCPFWPFPVSCITLISCSSNSGKTIFLKNLIDFRDRFFQVPPSQIIYVNGNQRNYHLNHPWNSEEDAALAIISLTLEEFCTDLTTLLKPHTVLILDDIVIGNTKEIEFVLTFASHHLSLYTFVVTQSCLSSNLYSLLNKVHFILLIFGHSNTNRLVHHLIHNYFLCSETKKYLKTIAGISEKLHDIVLLKLNSIRSYEPHCNVLALTQIQKLFQNPDAYCFVYPEIHRGRDLLQTTMNKTHSSQVHEDVNEEQLGIAHLPNLTGQYLNNAFVLLPANRVYAEQHSNNDVGPKTHNKQKNCNATKQLEWEAMTNFLEAELQSTFSYKLWAVAKNLLRSILRNSELCISSDYRTVFLHTKPKITYSIIDFIHSAITRSPPNAQTDALIQYKPLVQCLLRHNLPQTFIRNKHLLDIAKGQYRLDQKRNKKRH